MQPTPWTVDHTDPFWHQVCDAKGFVFAKCLEYEEDARLIAAAPELLAALKQLLDAAGYEWSVANRIGKDEWQRRSAIVGQAEAAIAKATGEQ